MLKESKGRTFGISEYGAGASIHDHENHPKHPKTDGKWLTRKNGSRRFTKLSGLP